MDSFLLREMTIEDYDQALSLWKRTPGMGLSNADSREALNRFLRKNCGFNFVYEENGIIIGTILCGNDGRRGYIYHLAVDEPFRRHGLGKKLVFKVLKMLAADKIDRCHIFVIGDNELGIRFWESTGWFLRDDLLLYSHDTHENSAGE